MRNVSDPTQTLSNPRHEAFVQALLRGEPATQAYVSAGYKAHHANAARMRDNEGVRRRLAELQRLATAKVVEETKISASDVIREVAKLGFSNMRNYVRSTEGGARTDLSHCTDDHWAAVQEITFEEKEHVTDATRVMRRIKIKLHNKEAALVTIGKHLGMFDKDKGAGMPPDQMLVPKAPSPDRLAEMRKRFAPNPHLRSIDGGKEE